MAQSLPSYKETIVGQLKDILTTKIVKKLIICCIPMLYGNLLNTHVAKLWELIKLKRVIFFLIIVFSARSRIKSRYAVNFTKDIKD